MKGALRERLRYRRELHHHRGHDPGKGRLNVYRNRENAKR
jgi:hypothetical protein